VKLRFRLTLKFQQQVSSYGNVESRMQYMLANENVGNLKICLTCAALERIL